MAINRFFVGLAAASLVLTAGILPAAASDKSDGYASGTGRPDDTGPGARLEVSYLADAGFAAAVKLDCDPAGGGHPRAAEACAILDAAGGEPDRIPAPNTACILIYAPVLAEVRGDWHGTTVAWQHRYGNSCEMRRALGALIAF
jgi:subtilisin inhibitor-like